MAAVNKTYETALAKLNAYIKRQGLRTSIVRNQVLEQVCRLRQPFTAEQLTQACEEERISLATIYNALTLFVSAQIVHASKRQRGRSAIEYELITGTQNRLQGQNYLQFHLHYTRLSRRRRSGKRLQSRVQRQANGT